MGRPHKSQRQDIVLGSVVDNVATGADADVLVERIGPDATGEANDILVPVAGGEHSQFAAGLADDIADQHGSHVDLVHVVDPGASDSDRAEAQEILDEAAAELDDVEVDTETLEGDSVVNTINERPSDYDIVMVGATREGILNQFVFGSVPEKIGWGSDGTVIMAKKNLGITSKLGSLL